MLSEEVGGDPLNGHGDGDTTDSHAGNQRGGVETHGAKQHQDHHGDLDHDEGNRALNSRRQDFDGNFRTDKVVANKEVLLDEGIDH